MRMVASYANDPPLNQFFGSGLVKTRITEELRKRAIVNLMATETFSFVRVSCDSPIENLLITKTIAALAKEMDMDAKAEMN